MVVAIVAVPSSRLVQAQVIMTCLSNRTEQARPCTLGESCKVFSVSMFLSA